MAGIKVFNIFIAVLTFNWGLTVSNPNQCPPEEFLQPCVCTPPSDLQCSGFVNLGDIEDVFRNLNGSSFKSFAIISSSMLYIPSSIFEASRISEFIVQNSTFTSFFDNPPVSTSLEKLTIERSLFQRSIRWNILSGFDLIEIKLVSNEIRKLFPSFGSGLPKTLKVIDIEEENLIHLSSDFLVSLNNLEALRIRSGKLHRLNKIAFPKSIKEIGISNCQLEFLPDGFFDDLPNLEVFFSWGNRLTSLKQEIFGPVKRVSVYGNKFVCDCSVKWILPRKDDFDGSCTTPEELKHRALSYLVEADFSYCT